MTERNDRHLLQDADNGDTTARLLRTAGLRDDVPADRAARVRREVLDECRAVARRRAVRRRAWGGAITLATAALLIVVVRLGTPRQDARAPVREIVATVARRLGDEGGRLTSAGGETLASTLLSPDDTIRAGDLVETDTTSRLGLRLASDVSLRLDAADLIDDGRVAAGALYVDTGRDAASLEIRTPFGVARDIGTQFELRLSDSSVRLRVRSGLVELQRGDDIVSARSGAELTYGAAGAVTRTVAIYGPEWAWTAGLALPFAIEGRSLAAVLDQLCHEHGWTSRYGRRRARA